MEFRAFVNQLDQSGELLRIKREVAPDYELAALLQQAEARHKALQFDNIAGARFPAVGAVLSDPDRHARAIGRDPAMLGKPGGWASLLAEARSRPLAARKTSGGPVGANVLTGADASLDILPIARFFAGDTHAFITAGLGIARDPVSGVQNVGFYRAPLIDATHFSVSAGGTSRLAQIYKDAAAQGPTLPVAYVIGAPPALLITAGCRIGREEADLDIAGALQGEALDLVQCQTSDLWVPASAEFVIEAEVMLDELIDHVMGEFPDQYGLTRSPVARITAITHRDDALFHTILGGMNREHNSLGSYIFLGLREQLLKELQPAFPGLRDIHVDLTPRRSGGRCQLAVSIDSSASTSPARAHRCHLCLQLTIFFRWRLSCSASS